MFKKIYIFFLNSFKHNFRFLKRKFEKNSKKEIIKSSNLKKCNSKKKIFFYLVK